MHWEEVEENKYYQNLETSWIRTAFLYNHKEIDRLQKLLMKYSS